MSRSDGCPSELEKKPFEAEFVFSTASERIELLPDESFFFTQKQPILLSQVQMFLSIRLAQVNCNLTQKGRLLQCSVSFQSDGSQEITEINFGTTSNTQITVTNKQTDQVITAVSAVQFFLQTFCDSSVSAQSKILWHCNWV